MNTPTSNTNTTNTNTNTTTNNNKQPAWEAISQYLVQRNLRTVPPAEARRLAEAGEWLVVDVRPPASHAKAAPKGSVSVPLYVPLEVTKKDGSGGFDLSKGLKALAYALNGVSGVEPNLQYEQQLAEVLRAKGAQGAIFLCEAGGTLRATPNFPAGKSSRSLQACFRALRDSLLPEDRILHVTGGAAGWYSAFGGDGFDGEYDAAEAGRTPNAAAEPTGQFVEAAKEKMSQTKQ
jgi:rhodanese-related sulfurtransferase